MKKTRREFLQILSTVGAAVATGIGTGVAGHAGATLTIPAGFEWDFVTPSHDDQVEAVRWLVMPDGSHILLHQGNWSRG